MLYVIGCVRTKMSAINSTWIVTHVSDLCCLSLSLLQCLSLLYCVPNALCIIVNIRAARVQQGHDVVKLITQSYYWFLSINTLTLLLIIILFEPHGSHLTVQCNHFTYISHSSVISLTKYICIRLNASVLPLRLKEVN